MRPPKQGHSHILQPLNDVFGTEAKVRLLRVLALHTNPFTAGELAKRAALGRTSIYPALGALECAGVIEFVGVGSQRLVQLRDRHPLSRVLRELFRAESHRFEAFTIALRDLISRLPYHAISAWIDESAPGVRSVDSLSLHVVARPEELQTLTDALNASLAEVEREYDIHVAVHGLTRSELETLDHRQPVTGGTWTLIGGVPPAALLERSRSKRRASTRRSHDDHDARSRRLALAIAAKIKRDPGLIAVAEDRVKHRARKAGPGERRELAEWVRILETMPPARLRRFLLEDSERAIRLRQSLPALNLLSPEERDAVVASRTDADVLAAIER